MRIPLPSTSDQSLMQGLVAGGNLRAQQYRNALAQAQGKSMLGNLALAQQFEPFKQQLASAQAGELGAKANALNTLTPLQKSLLEMKTNPKAFLAYQTAVINGLNNLGGGVPSPVGSEGGGVVAGAAAPQSSGNMTPISWSGDSPVAQNPVLQSSATAQNPTTQPVSNNGLPGNLSLGQMYAYHILGLNPNDMPSVKIAEANAIAQNQAILKAQLAQNAAALKVQTTQAGQESASNVKKANTALQNMRNLVSTGDTLQQLKGIVQTNPQIFSWLGAPFEEKFSSNPAVGQVQSLAGPLIATMTHSISQRGGLGMAKMVSNMKPGLNTTAEVNAGRISALENIRHQEIVNNILDYHDATGNWPNVPGMAPYVSLAQQQLTTGKNNTVSSSNTNAAPSFPEGFTRKIGDNSYVWSGGKWRHS